MLSRTLRCITNPHDSQEAHVNTVRFRVQVKIDDNDDDDDDDDNDDNDSYCKSTNY